MNLCLSVFIIFTVWIPSTRLFMTDIGWGTIVVFIVSMILCYTSMDTYSRDKSKISILTFMIGLSPLIWFVIIFLMAFFMKPAP